jgi:hypothetical protein
VRCPNCHVELEAAVVVHTPRGVPELELHTASEWADAEDAALLREAQHRGELE